MRRSSILALLAGLIALGIGPAGADETPGRETGAATVGIRTANAQAGDERGVYDYEVLPRGVVQDYVAVSNFRYRPIKVRLFAKDATSNADTTFAIQRSDEQPHDVGAWVVLRKNKLTLPPRSETIVPFQLGVPHNATPGDHAGAIVVSLLAREPKPEGGTIVVDHRVGMRIHLRVPGSMTPELRVENLRVDWAGGGDLLGRGDVTVSYTVRNSGNVRMSAEGQVELTRALGLPSVSAEAEPVEDILPGGATSYVQRFENVLGTGPMKAVVTLDPHPVDVALPDVEPVAAERGLPAWPWLLLSEAFGLLVLLLGGGWYQRRRRPRTPKDTPMTPAHRKTATTPGGVLVRALLLAALAVGAGLLSASAAQAAEGDEWQAKLTRKEGAGGDPFDLLTSGGCPAPATNVVGFGYGHGFPKDGAVIVSNTSAGVSSEWGFQMPLVDSMTNLMLLQPDPKPLQGVYRFALRCIEAEWPDRSFGEYVVSIEFDSPNHWKVLPPLTREPGPTSYAPSSGPGGEPLGGTGQDPDAPGAQPDAGSSEPVPGDTATGGAAEETDAQRAEQLLNGETTGADVADGSGISWPLMVAGIGVLVAVAAMLVGRRGTP